jgi:hypothetical protein
MDFMQADKFVNIVPPAVALNAGSAVVNSYVDGIGFGRATFIIQAGAVGADMTACKIQECETSGGSYTDITTYGAGTTFKTATDANGLQIISFQINGTRMRFFKPVLTAGAASTYLSAICILSEAQQAPYDATTRGLLYNTIS